MKVHLPRDEYYKTLSRVPTSGGALFRNTKGEFLILKNNYKANWNIVGGMCDEHETALEATIREIKEEIGLTVEKFRPFCVDYATSEPFDRILFMFDGGVLSDEMIKNIVLEKDEITDMKFVSEKEMLELVSEKLGARIKNSLDAFYNNYCVYLENGQPIK